MKGKQMGTKNNPGRFDCYANADADEPMFVLLARDKHAPTLIWLWAALRELDGEDAAKVQEARYCCMAMMEWQRVHDRKVAGIGQAALAAVLELIQGVNLAAKPDGATIKTSDDMMRLFLGQARFEVEEDASPS
jgi:hypothetical protein